MSDSGSRRLVIAQMLESDGPVGAEIMMLRLAVALRERGHDVVPVGPAAGCGWLSEQFRKRGFHPEAFVLRHPLDLRCVRDLASMLKRRGVDVVHSHEFTMAVYGTASAKWVGVPHVITMHGNQRMATRWRRRIALRAAFSFSDAVVAVSRDTKRFLDAQLDLRTDRLGVVANGVPMPAGDRQRVRAELGMGSDEQLVFAAGSLVPRKGHALLMRAMAAQSSTPAWRLAIAGSGPERSALETLAGDLGIAARVHLLGHRDDIDDLLAATDIYAMPSLWEGLPLALLEAMAAGRPIVASATSGIPEAVDSEIDGLLTTPGELNELTMAIERLRTNAGLRHDLGERALRRARAEFSIDAMATAYEQIYLQAAKRLPSRSGAREGRRGLAPTPAIDQRGERRD